MLVHPEKRELLVERLSSVWRVRAEAGANAPISERIEERHGAGIDARSVPPGLLFEAQHLVEEGSVEGQAGVPVCAE